VEGPKAKKNSQENAFPERQFGKDRAERLRRCCSLLFRKAQEGVGSQKGKKVFVWETCALGRKASKRKSDWIIVKKGETCIVGEERKGKKEKKGEYAKARGHAQGTADAHTIGNLEVTTTQ